MDDTKLNSNTKQLCLLCQVSIDRDQLNNHVTECIKGKQNLKRRKRIADDDDDDCDRKFITFDHFYKDDCESSLFSKQKIKPTATEQTNEVDIWSQQGLHRPLFGPIDHESISLRTFTKKTLDKWEHNYKTKLKLERIRQEEELRALEEEEARRIESEEKERQLRIQAEKRQLQQKQEEEKRLKEAKTLIKRQSVPVNDKAQSNKPPIPQTSTKVQTTLPVVKVAPSSSSVQASVSVKPPPFIPASKPVVKPPKIPSKNNVAEKPKPPTTAAYNTNNATPVVANVQPAQKKSTVPPKIPPKIPPKFPPKIPPKKEEIYKCDMCASEFKTEQEHDEHVFSCE
ncbi:exocyst complex component SEC3 [Acrasis kona]|uniref:Exocyst complex component SEC3 n=1 Tax=Acrasis kona TaxID=1008807 RepID=A0AAW2ZLS4_9EUKA